MTLPFSSDSRLIGDKGNKPSGYLYHCCISRSGLEDEILLIFDLNMLDLRCRLMHPSIRARALSRIPFHDIISPEASCAAVDSGAAISCCFSGPITSLRHLLLGQRNTQRVSCRSMRTSERCFPMPRRRRHSSG